MRLHDLTESPRKDISQFSQDFNDENIVKKIQGNAPRRNPKWIQTIIKMMDKYGFKLIGAGINGAVFHNPKYPYVLKVYRQDYGYDEWLYFIRTHPNNKYVPKLRGQVLRLNKIFSAVRMEYLVPAPVGDANALDFKIQDLMDLSWKDRKEIEDKDLLDIANFMKDNEPIFDLTHHNIMMRKNGELVIIDPLYMEHGQEIDW